MSSSTNKKTDQTQQVESGPSLLPFEKARSEAAEHRRYAGRFLALVLVQGPIVAWSLYLAFKYFLLSTASRQLLEAKFRFLYDYQLNYVYVAAFGFTWPNCPWSPTPTLPVARRAWIDPTNTLTESRARAIWS